MEVRGSKEKNTKPVTPRPEAPPTSPTHPEAGIANDAWKNWQTFSTGRDAFHVDGRYEFQGKLGSGAYAVVCAAKDKKTEKKVAIKKVVDLFGSKTDTVRILREIQILQHLAGNRHICSLEDLMIPDPKHKFDHCYLVLGYMPADLHKVIYSKNTLTDKHICYMVYQMFCALKFFHSANIVHRDLKPSNILVNRNCHIRICDFGLARDIQYSNDAMTQYVVTRWYRAPEVICSRKYDAQIDVWSVGCILAEMLGKKALFPGDDYVVQMKLMFEYLGCPPKSDLEFIDLPNAKKWAMQYIEVNKERIKVMDLKARFPKRDERCLDIVKKTLTINPAKRITVEEALKSPWFKRLRNKTWEKPCDSPFVFKYDEDVKLSTEEAKDAVLKQVAVYRPEVLGQRAPGKDHLKKTSTISDGVLPQLDLVDELKKKEGEGSKNRESGTPKKSGVKAAE